MGLLETEFCMNLFLSYTLDFTVFQFRLFVINFSYCSVSMVVIWFQYEK